MFWPCETRTSTCRSFATISSGLYRFLAIAVLLDVKGIPQVGPLQWGWIRRLSTYRLPEDDWTRHVAFIHTVSFAEGADLPVYVRVMQAAGNQAWSSPIYLIE